MASSCSLGLLTCFGQEENEGKLGQGPGSTGFQLASSCPANADLHCSDTHQIWVGHNCPGSRPPLPLLLPEPRGQPDLYTKFSLVSLMAQRGAGVGDRTPQQHAPRGHRTLLLPGSEAVTRMCRKVSLGFMQMYFLPAIVFGMLCSVSLKWADGRILEV